MPGPEHVKDEPLTQPVPALTEQTAQQEKTDRRQSKVGGCVKCYDEEMQGTKRVQRSGPIPFREDRSFMEGAGTYKMRRGEPGKSGSMFQAEGTATAKRGHASGNPTGEEARAQGVVLLC